MGKPMSEAVKKHLSDVRATKLDVSAIKDAYSSGLSQSEVAKMFGVTTYIIFAFMHRHNIPARPSTERKQGKNNPNWKGDEVTYGIHHARVRKIRGQPKNCEVCGTTAENIRYEWASLSGRYNDPNDYKRMCRKCHRKYDHLSYVRKTHCVHGHEFTEQNTIWYGGHRRCRECNRLRCSQYYQSKQKEKSTHCKNGHLYTDDNVYWYKGWRNCKVCIRETRKRRKEKIRNLN